LGPLGGRINRRVGRRVNRRGIGHGSCLLSVDADLDVGRYRFFTQDPCHAISAVKRLISKEIFFKDWVSHPVHLSLRWVTGVTGHAGGIGLNTLRRGSVFAWAELRLERPLQPIAN
jgi:hypothetical protein